MKCDVQKPMVFCTSQCYAFCLNKTHLEGHSHRKNSKIPERSETFLRVSSMRMAFQMRSVEAERKLYKFKFLSAFEMMLMICSIKLCSINVLMLDLIVYSQ